MNIPLPKFEELDWIDYVAALKSDVFKSKTMFQYLDTPIKALMIFGLCLSITAIYLFLLFSDYCFREYDLQTDADKLTPTYAVRPLGWFAFFLFT